MQTGKKIKLLRNIKGLSQEMLAEKIGRTRALVSHIEQTGKVNHHTLKLILKVFSMSEDDFENFEQKNVNIQTYKISTAEDNKLNNLRDKLAAYQKENEVLKELITTQKQMIAILKKGKK